MKEEKVILKEVVNYIRNVNIGNLVYRKILINNCSNGGSTVDNYRNYLTHAGYLRIKSRGVYEYIKEIPKDITYKRLVREAYPGRRWTM
jgi:uncharacterized protein YutE (UPF0331/DUF86 family)